MVGHAASDVAQDDKFGQTNVPVGHAGVDGHEVSDERHWLEFGQAKVPDGHGAIAGQSARVPTI